MTESDGQGITLRILATSDLHMNLRGFDHYLDAPCDGIGLTRVATLIRAARAEAAGAVVLLDNGDSLQGTPLDVPALGIAGGHPFLRCLADLGYDAVGLGNHDFNFGLDVLNRAIGAAPCPVLCANAVRRDGGEFRARPGVIVTRDTSAGPLRVGVLSVLPPQTAMWDAEILRGALEVGDMVPAATATAAELRSQGADVVIALAHTGLGEDSFVPGQENALRALAATPGIDALVGGHTHLLLPDPAAPETSAEGAGRIAGRTVAMPGSAGSHLAVIDLRLARDGGRWRVTGGRSHLRATKGVAEDARLTAITDDLHGATRAALARPVGQAPVAMHTQFCFVAPSAALSVVAAAQVHAVGDLAGGLPVLSAVAPGKMGGRGGPANYTDVPAGVVRERHLADLCVYPNKLALVEIDGAGIADWLEMAVSLYHRITPGAGGQPLIDPVWSGHGFDVIHGLSYCIDLSQSARFDPDGRLRDPAARRITDLRHAGRVVEPGDRFLVATNTYRANGGGHVRTLDGRPRHPVPDLTLRAALGRYLADGRFPDAPLDPVFRFAPIPGAALELDCGPGAAAHLGEVADRGAVLSPPRADGFLRLTLSP